MALVCRSEQFSVRVDVLKAVEIIVSCEASLQRGAGDEIFETWIQVALNMIGKRGGGVRKAGAHSLA